MADERARPNLLVVNVSPEECIVIRAEAKKLGQEMRLQSINLDYCRSDERDATGSPSAYEHLLLDSLRGDATLCARADEVEAAWKIVDTWAIRYMTVDTRNWWPGKKVLVSPEWIERVDWSEAKVHVGMTREQIKQSPEFDPMDPVARDYEARLHDHYGRPTYWERQAR